MIYVVGIAVVVFALAAGGLVAWLTSPSTTGKVVAARVVTNAGSDPNSLANQLALSIDQQARALAISRSVEAMVEAQAKTVGTPWANASSSPKA